MNLLKVLFGNLIKTGVEQPDGTQTFARRRLVARIKKALGK